MVILLVLQYIAACDTENNWVIKGRLWLLILANTTSHLSRVYGNSNTEIYSTILQYRKYCNEIYYNAVLYVPGYCISPSSSVELSIVKKRYKDFQGGMRIIQIWK